MKSKTKKRSYATLERENRSLRSQVESQRKQIEDAEAFRSTIFLAAAGGAITLDRLARQVLAHGKPVVLGHNVLLLLELLMLHQGKTLTNEFLIGAIWSPEERPKAGMLAVLVHQLRRALGPSGAAVLVVRGQGYTIAEDSGAAL